MKKLFKFTLNKEIEIEKPELSKDSEGKDITILRKVKELQPHYYFITKPTRSLSEAAEMYFASIVSKCISQGIFSVSLLQKRVLNDGGVYSEEQKKTYESLYNKLFEKQSLHKSLIAKIEQTPEHKEEIDKVFNEIVSILGDIQNLETQTGNNIFQNTAENIARNRCSIFWMLNLSYKEEDGKEIPVFAGKTYEEKLTSYDKLEENENEFEIELLRKLFLITSLWYLGKAQKQEDFEILLKLSENQGIIEAVSNIPEQELNNEQEELNLEH